MADHPILFSGEMVRAILEGRKMQTRRVIKPQPTGNYKPTGLTYMQCYEFHDAAHEAKYWNCPYGKPGDQLWVRETWKPGAWRENGRVAVDYRASPELTNTPWLYPPKWHDVWPKWTDEIIAAGLQEEDGRYRWEPGKSPMKWRPSIFMPHWASRITLDVVNIRVERLEDISIDDIYAEGCPPISSDEDGSELYEWYFDLWDTINAKRCYGWESNPWVWVIEFKRLA